MLLVAARSLRLKFCGFGLVQSFRRGFLSVTGLGDEASVSMLFKKQISGYLPDRSRDTVTLSPDQTTNPYWRQTGAIFIYLLMLIALYIKDGKGRPRRYLSLSLATISVVES